MSKIKMELPKGLELSKTSAEPGITMTGYVWDTSKTYREDPFFAVPSIVLIEPTTQLSKDEKTSISLSF
jgi:hypothetical protein